MGERGVDRLFPERRQAAPDRAVPPSLAPGRRRLGLSGLAVRRELWRGRRLGRDAVAASAGRRGRRRRFARRLDARAAAAASLAPRGRALHEAQTMGRRARDRRASRLLQAHHRRIARRRVAAAGGEGAGRSRGRRRGPHGPAADRLFAGAAHPDGRGFRGADRRSPAYGSAGARRGQALSVLSRAIVEPPGRRDASSARVALGLDHRMEVRRHPRAVAQARRELAPVVARRRADLRRLSRSRAAGARAPFGHGDRRRACRAHPARARVRHGFARWPRDLRQPAAAAGPQDRQRKDEARIAGRIHRLRHSGERGPRSSSRAAACAPRSA